MLKVSDTELRKELSSLCQASSPMKLSKNNKKKRLHFPPVFHSGSAAMPRKGSCKEPLQTLRDAEFSTTPGRGPSSTARSLPKPRPRTRGSISQVWTWPLGTPKPKENPAPELLLSAHQQKKWDAGFKKSSSKQWGQENMKAGWRGCKRLNWPALCQLQHYDGEKVLSLGFNISAFLEHVKDRLFQQEELIHCYPFHFDRKSGKKKKADLMA